MALPVKNFYGSIGGKNIGDYTKDLNYQEEDVQERIKLVREKLGVTDIDGVEFGDKYWLEVFEQTFDTALSKDGLYYCQGLDKMLNYQDFISWCKANCIDPIDYLEITNPFQDLDLNADWEYSNANTSKVKLVINISDGLYSDTNVAQGLGRLADYILAKAPKNKEENIKMYNDKELFQKAIKEQEKVGNATEEGLLFLKDTNKNFKKEKKQVILPEDETLPVICEYVTALNFYVDRLKALDCIDKSKLTQEELKEINKKRYLYRKTASEIKRELPRIKDMIKGTIYFKSPLSDKGGADWDELDMFDKEQVKRLLAVKKGDDFQDDISVIVVDLNNLVKECEFTDIQKQVLVLWREDKSLTDIGNILKQSVASVSTALDRAVTTIIDKYEEHYTNWYYLNVCKGEYKKCKKCGEILLTNKFHKDSKSKDGYKSKCKKCR